MDDQEKLKEKKVPKWIGLVGLAVAVFGMAPHAIAQNLSSDNPLKLEVAGTKVRAYNIKTTTLSGKPFSLTGQQGNVVFLNFWATWCAPCRAEMPAMERLHQQMKGLPFTMLAVNIQEPQILVKKFVSDLKLTFTILMDPAGEISETYGASNLPLTYIINKKGYVIRRAIGPREWDTPASIQLFKKLAAE